MIPFLFFLLAAVPLVLMFVCIIPELKFRWRSENTLSRSFLIITSLIIAFLLVLRPHDDSFSGLDTMGYRHLSDAYESGFRPGEVDRVFTSVPEKLRQFFLLDASGVRLSRDISFQYENLSDAKRVPFFMPALPASASGMPFFPPEYFVPAAGVCWFLLMLACGFIAGGVYGTAAVLALSAGTAWPFWFLRGFYAEGVGAVMVTSALLCSMTSRSRRPQCSSLAFFVFGYSVNLHPTMAMFAAPAALAVLVSAKNVREMLKLICFALPGIAVFALTTHYICHPYGDWTDPDVLRRIIEIVPVIKALVVALAFIALICFAGIAAALNGKIREAAIRTESRLAPWCWIAAAVFPFSVLYFCRHNVFSAGIRAMWSGCWYSYAVLILVASFAVFAKGGVIIKFLWTCLAWIASVCILFLGEEVQVGIWSQRRFLPVIMTAVAVLAPPLGVWCRSLKTREFRVAAISVVLLLGFANAVRYPFVYTLRNERGAKEYVSSVAAMLGGDSTAVFDYIPHSAPYTCRKDVKVLGTESFGESKFRYSFDNWGRIVQWLNGKARDEKVMLVSSWPGTVTLEENAVLEPIAMTESVMRFPVVRSKLFFPAEKSFRVVENHFSRMRPISPDDWRNAVQNKSLSGSPYGLRGNWGLLKDGMMWTMEESGVIGPFPPFEARVRISVSGRSGTDASREFSICPPWGGPPAVFTFTPEESEQTAELTAPERNGFSATGIYRINSREPLDICGEKGYGVQLRGITITPLVPLK